LLALNLAITHFDYAKNMLENPDFLTLAQAERFTALALAGIQREYPNHPGHLLNGPDDLRTPRELHPAFYGCLDWHSAVHSHWLLVRLLRLFPELPQATAVRTALDENLTAANLQAEADYFLQPNRQSFERPYGWGWLLQLAAELHDWAGAKDSGAAWARQDWAPQVWARQVSRYLQPLVEVIVGRYHAFLPQLTYPIRVGTHANTAFGLALALDYARTVEDEPLAALLIKHSRAYFSQDVAYPAQWEPNGHDFFSPCLIEADLMTRILPPAQFSGWLARFLPGIVQGQPATLFTPVTVSNRRDPQIVHLDGLNLSRAWCLRHIAAALPDAEPARASLLAAAGRHAQAGLAHVSSGDYMGEHWLASFAVYLLTVTAV
jgi:hypothetical protein